MKIFRLNERIHFLLHCYIHLFYPTTGYHIIPFVANAVQVNRTNTGARLYTFPSGGLSGPTPPRPLYIPPANRGDELAIRVTAEEVVIYLSST